MIYWPEYGATIVKIGKGVLLMLARWDEIVMWCLLLTWTECGAVQAARVTDVTSHQLRLSWDRPGHLNGILLGYVLTYTGKNGLRPPTQQLASL